jgi:hypothetical protein
MTWDGRHHYCHLCDKPGPRCGKKNPAGRQNECTREAGHTKDCALCGWMPNTHPVETWPGKK